MAPAARTADSMWTRLGRAVSDSPAVIWFNDSVLGNPHLARGRGLVREGWTRILDVCYPLIVLGRGTRRGAGLLGAWWKDAPKDKRRLQSVIVLVCLIGVGLLSYGPLLLILGYLGTAAWLGRDTSRKGADPESAAHIGRLQSVYNGLVPYLQNGDDPDQHFTPGGGYRDAFTGWEFDEQDRLVRLRLDYSQYFKDGEADSRAKVERALEGKIGHSNEYLYAWDEEGNHLDVRILPPLPDGIGAQPWPVADIEFVLGVTDPGSAGRLIPVAVADPDASEDTLTPLSAVRDGLPPGFRIAQLAPVVWRIGSPTAHPHLLVTGGTSTGKSTAVRSLLGQALARGHRVAVIDTDQSAEYGALTGRTNVLRVTEEPADSLDLLDWFGLEMERRAEQGRGHGHGAIESKVLPVAQRDSGTGTNVGTGAGTDGSTGTEVGARMDGGTGSSVGAGAGRGAGTVVGVGADGALADRRSAGGAFGTVGAPADGVTATEASADAAADVPLWLFVDDLPELCAAAARLGRPDPQDALAALARKARFARTTLVITARTDQIAALRPALRNQLTARIALGRVDPVSSTLLFGGTLELGGAQVMPPGRGYARIGSGPVIRLQTPYAPTLALSAV